ncbi:MAG: Gfo/Idh/MocA family oxidoreductase [Ruthenibacterium lactatiformans]
MLRIGMIGADNFHALAFSRLANLPPEEGGSGLPARVTMLWGESAQRAAFVANEAHIHTVVDDPARMLGQVDAVMVVLRHGAQHHDAALPFLRAGISTWVDKPFTTDIGQAAALVAAARRAARCWQAAPRANTARMCFGCGTIPRHVRGRRRDLGRAEFPRRVGQPLRRAVFLRRPYR